jgi:hypothetical protein
MSGLTRQVFIEAKNVPEKELKEKGNKFYAL